MPAFTIHRYGRYWAVHDENGDLVCVTVYLKGAMSVVRLLTIRTLERTAHA